jgi:hypothetical protein
VTHVTRPLRAINIHRTPKEMKRRIRSLSTYGCSVENDKLETHHYLGLMKALSGVALDMGIIRRTLPARRVRDKRTGVFHCSSSQLKLKS